MDTKVIKSLAARVKEEADQAYDNDSANQEIRNQEIIRCAANLAHRGLLQNVNRIGLFTDLSRIPTKHLASLVSTVKSTVGIMEDTGCDLVAIFDSLKCEELTIGFQSLGTKESSALGRAMKSLDIEVRLIEVHELDVEAMTENSEKWDGEWYLWCQCEIAVTYARELRRWAQRSGYSYFEEHINEQQEDMIVNLHGVEVCP